MIEQHLPLLANAANIRMLLNETVKYNKYNKTEYNTIQYNTMDLTAHYLQLLSCRYHLYLSIPSIYPTVNLISTKVLVFMALYALSLKHTKCAVRKIDSHSREYGALHIFIHYCGTVSVLRNWILKNYILI